VKIVILIFIFLGVSLSASSILLTPKEKDYIKDNKTINICIKNHQEPLVIKGKDEYSGISIDYIDATFSSVGFIPNYIYNYSMKTYLDGIKNGRCDMVSFVITKPNKHKFLTPSVACASDTLVIATSIDTLYLDDLSMLKDEKIMIKKDAKNLRTYIQHFYPNLNLIGVDKIDFEKIANGEIYGAIGGSYLMAYSIASTHPYRLKIMTKISNTKIEGSFGVSNKEPLLLSILNNYDIAKLPKCMKFDMTHINGIITPQIIFDNITISMSKNLINETPKIIEKLNKYNKQYLLPVERLDIFISDKISSVRIKSIVPFLTTATLLTYETSNLDRLLEYLNNYRNALLKFNNATIKNLYGKVVHCDLIYDYINWIGKYFRTNNIDADHMINTFVVEKLID